MRIRECIILAFWLLTALSAWAADDAAELPEGLGLDVPPVKIGTAAPLAPAPNAERWNAERVGAAGMPPARQDAFLSDRMSPAHAEMAREGHALGARNPGMDASIEHLRWSGTPIPLALPVGQDRVVRFPADVRVGPPGKLLEVLQTTAADGAVYFRALAPFEPTLVLVQEAEAPGRTFAFQLRAEQGASTAPVEIVAPQEKMAESSVPADVSAEIEAASLPKRYGYVALTRYAAQQLYAPDRLLHELEGVYRVPVPDRGTVPLIRTAGTLAEIEATPLASWADETGLYVTVVRLRNRTYRAVILDPRTALRGEWLAATFQHARLLPAGHEADTTAVYLISARPFSDALGIVPGGR